MKCRIATRSALCLQSHLECDSIIWPCQYLIALSYFPAWKAYAKCTEMYQVQPMQRVPTEAGVDGLSSPLSRLSCFPFSLASSGSSFGILALSLKLELKKNDKSRVPKRMRCRGKCVTWARGRLQDWHTSVPLCGLQCAAQLNFHVSACCLKYCPVMSRPTSVVCDARRH